MKISSILRATLIALTALFAASSIARADSGSITFELVKGGWFIGGQAGSGTLVFQGRRYPISIGGLSAGLVFGGSVTRFRGTVTNIRSPYDVAGVYGAAGAGGAAIVGAQVITMRNEKGAILRLSGRQVGLQLQHRSVGNGDFRPVAFCLSMIFSENRYPPSDQVHGQAWLTAAWIALQWRTMLSCATTNFFSGVSIS